MKCFLVMMLRENAEKAIRSLQVIEDEIKALEETRQKDTEAHNIKALFAIDQRINKLKEKKKQLGTYF